MTGKQLRDRRQEMGLTREALAEKLKMPPQIIEYWEEVNFGSVIGLVYSGVLELAVEKLEIDIAFEKCQPEIDAKLAEVEEVVARPI